MLVVAIHSRHRKECADAMRRCGGVDGVLPSRVARVSVRLRHCRASVRTDPRLRGHAVPTAPRAPRQRWSLRSNDTYCPRWHTPLLTSATRGQVSLSPLSSLPAQRTAGRVGVPLSAPLSLHSAPLIASLVHPRARTVSRDGTASSRARSTSHSPLRLCPPWPSRPTTRCSTFPAVR